MIFTEFVYATLGPLPARRPVRPRAPAGPAGRAAPASAALRATAWSPRTPRPGPDSAEIVPELAPRPGELVVRGHTYDKFLRHPAGPGPPRRDIRYLVITGVVTDVCVNCTLLSAANRDYRVTAVTDGVATLWPELQEACFAIWRRKFARLRTTEEVMAEIRGEPVP